MPNLKQVNKICPCNHITNNKNSHTYVSNDLAFKYDYGYIMFTTKNKRNTMTESDNKSYYSTYE